MPTEPPVPNAPVSTTADHLNLPPWGPDQAILRDMTLAANAHIANVIGGPIPEPFPEPLQQAQRMLVGHWFEAREATSPDGIRTVPFGFDELVQSYRRWVV